MDRESCISDEASKQLHSELQQGSDSPCVADQQSQQTVSFGISPSYVKDWDTTDAFRELYQNWKDAILERFQLDRRDFKLHFEDGKDHFSIIGSSASGDHADLQARGLIQNEKKTGRVILTNASTQLPVESLIMGHTTKAGDQRLSSSHGEGLKLAALVMNRHQYKMSIAASHCNWNFGLHGPQQSLRCVIMTACKPNLIEQRETVDDMADLHSRIERDVAVVIGAGRGHQSRPVSPKTFLRWLRVTLDIHQLTSPSSMIPTPQGDLLLDAKFSGKLFLHGVRLSMPTVGGKVFKFGYNFAFGKFSRDRQRMISCFELADLVRQIWEHALSLHEGLLLPSYIDLLRNYAHLGDVDKAEILLEPSTKTRIWEHLVHASRDKLFFYSAETNSQTVDAIRKCTGRKPTTLPKSFWQLLRSASPIRTIEEEQQRLCRNAKARALPGPALKAPSKMKVVYVDNLTGRLDVLYHAAEGTLSIPHQRWDFDSMDQRGLCRDLVPTTVGGQYAPFSWRDVVEELLVLSIPSLCTASPMSRITEIRYMRQVRRLLQWFPHNIQISLHAGSLLVTWEDNEAETIQRFHEGGPEYKVILHAEHCGAEAELLHPEAGKSTPPNI
ncbi:hypothetical protein N7466_001623 [Penicillium verhagenii]|uniref:uncharacterized protein n=1 Tax=Penicillium verhagenii TaxID=1562060 RepID=UPI002545A342|nr:uncharacterized protein N7466_001623 [Penicillium verhagenii]KAJ5938489.1 hypothetical protein N7466_001623 [Penicillium verhagenii]